MDFTLSVRSFVESCWNDVLQLFGNDEWKIFTWGTSLMMLLSYFGINAVFVSLDLLEGPKFVRNYKIQAEKNIPVDLRKLFRCFVVSLRNELTNCALIFLCYKWMRDWGMTCNTPLPSIWGGFFQYLVMMIGDEIVFYYGHRALHSSQLYKHFHKMHHEWTAPISMSASYTHPLENIIVKFLPMFIGPVLVGAHLSVTWVWIFMYQLQTVVNHSGYHFPGLPSPQFHDFHHLRFNECFGSNGFLDWFHKTDVQFRNSIQGKRHKKYYKLSPVSDIHPNPVKRQ